MHTHICDSLVMAISSQIIHSISLISFILFYIFSPLVIGILNVVNKFCSIVKLMKCHNFGACELFRGQSLRKLLDFHNWPWNLMEAKLKKKHCENHFVISTRSFSWKYAICQEKCFERRMHWLLQEAVRPVKRLRMTHKEEFEKYCALKSSLSISYSYRDRRR